MPQMIVMSALSPATLAEGGGGTLMLMGTEPPPPPPGTSSCVHARWIPRTARAACGNNIRGDWAGIHRWVQNSSKAAKER